MATVVALQVSRKIGDMSELCDLLTSDRRAQTETLSSAIADLSCRLDLYKRSLDKALRRLLVDAEKQAQAAEIKAEKLESTLRELQKDICDLHASHKEILADVAEKQLADRLPSIIISSLPETSNGARNNLNSVLGIITDTLKVNKRDVMHVIHCYSVSGAEIQHTG